MIFRFVEAHRRQYPVRVMCRVLEVSTSGYYAWRSRPESRRSQANRALMEQLRAAHKRGRGTYGSPRVHRELRAQGVACSVNRVARLMRSADIRGRRRPKFRVTTDSHHNLPVGANHLDRQFTAARVNTVWTADITYIWTLEGWLYLAVVLGSVLSPDRGLVHVLVDRRAVGRERAPDGGGPTPPARWPAAPL